MKKMALILSLIMTSSLAANAYVDSQYTQTEQFLTNVGYSAEAAKVLTIVNQDPYREQYVEPTTPKQIFRRIYHYIVPGENDDLDFYNHSTNFDGWGWKDY